MYCGLMDNALCLHRPGSPAYCNTCTPLHEHMLLLTLAFEHQPGVECLTELGVSWRAAPHSSSVAAICAGCAFLFDELQVVHFCVAPACVHRCRNPQACDIPF